ncbi:MAG: CHAT domain-containing protein [Phormidesmis sp.]
MKAVVIQEFEISITAVGGDQYLVRTENVAKGVQLAEEKVRWPVAQWLEKTQSFMHDPLLGLLQGQQRQALPTRMGQSSPSPHLGQAKDTDATTLVHLGQTLHNELFKGQLHDSWVTAQGVAQNRQDLLRLRIGMKDSRLQQLPWEALHAGTRPLATGTDVIFSRYILDRRQGHSAHLAKANESAKALRILMVIASPDDQARLELKQEVHHLRSELHPVGIDDDDTLLDVQLKILEQPGRAELTQELDRGNYQVLHYAGHSDLGNAGGDLYLVSRQTGLTERLSGEDLAGLLVNNGIKLAVFNSCRGGYSSNTEQGWQERNLAQALINRGMPSVIAMADRIPDHVAVTFTQLLYRNLRKGQSIDLSLNRTRQGLISAYGSHQFYWALPTLYMQPSFNGYLLKTVGDRENVSLLDSNNDPFGSIFSEPGLANLDWPVPRGGSSTLPLEKTPFDIDSDIDVTNNPDAEPIELEVDGELLVPEAIETPSGFYGEQSAAISMPSPLSSSRSSRSSDDAAQPPQVRPIPPAKGIKSNRKADESSELIGERLARSHTLHTKLLTIPGIASMVMIVLLSIITVGWFQRARQIQAQPSASIPASVQSLSLPAQVEVALNNDDLDTAAIATRALIDQGNYQSALTALGAASQRQQEDVIVSFLKGRSQWSLAKQGNSEFSAADALLSWTTALKSEPDWMEISMALGFAQYAVGREELALESWQQAIDLAARQPAKQSIYFSNQPTDKYILNAYAGVAMSSLALSKIETNSNERNRLLEQAIAAYTKVINEAPADFNGQSLGNNWLWLSPAIADWSKAKQELSQSLR